MIFLQQFSILSVMLFLLCPVIFFDSKFTFHNWAIDIPILVILNIVFLFYFLEREIKKYSYQSIFLLIISAVAVFSSFFRIIPMPAGISLAFLLPIVTGVVFGPVFGFIIGQLSMLVGGVFLGAFGPWLPYQSLLMGMIGYYAGIFFHQAPRNSRRWFVVGYAVVVSFFYGYWMSVSYWPVAVRDVSVESSVLGKLKMYSQYYMLTSFFWDCTRAVGNAVIFVIFFQPACELFERAKLRLAEYKSRT